METTDKINALVRNTNEKIAIVVEEFKTSFQDLFLEQATESFQKALGSIRGEINKAIVVQDVIAPQASAQTAPASAPVKKRWGMANITDPARRREIGLKAAASRKKNREEKARKQEARTQRLRETVTEVKDNVIRMTPRQKEAALNGSGPKLRGLGAITDPARRSAIGFKSAKTRKRRAAGRKAAATRAINRAALAALK